MDLRKYLWLLTILLIKRATACPTGMVPYILDKNICYSFETQKMAFLNAEEFCQQYNGHLVSIQNMFENDFVAQKAQVYITDSSDVWMGANDLVNKGSWNWLDGSDFSFSDWDKGQPQNVSGYDCGALLIQDGRWIADDCFKKKNFVCMVLAQSAVTSATSPLTTTTTATTTKTTTKQIPTTSTTAYNKKCKDSWQSFNFIGYCYKAFDLCQTWRTSNNSCISLKSQLASIHSEPENSFVTKLISYNSNCPYAYANYYAAIGAYTTSDSSSWQWTDGTPFDYSAFTGSADGYYCGTMFSGISTWKDVQCNFPIGSYVCKKLPS